MSTRITKTCPHCKATYDDRNYIGKPSKYNQQRYGSPVRRCSNCGESFVDMDYREIAISGPRVADTMIVSPATLIDGGFSIVLGCAVVLFVSWWGLFLALLGVWRIAHEARGHKGRLERIERERMESEERVSAPGYIDLLKRLGYKFPKDYFDVG